MTALRVKEATEKQPVQGKASICIVHVLNGLPFGGNENLCLQLIKQAPFGVQSYLVNLNPHLKEMLPLFQAVPNLVIVEQPYSAQSRFHFLWQLIGWFRKLQPQAVLIYPFGIHVLVGLAARLAGIKTITVHAGNPAPPNPIDQLVWRRIILFSRFLKIPIYPCSKIVQTSFEALTPLPSGSFVISNGCDVDTISHRAQATREHRPINSKTVIGMVARLDQIKDQATLIHAFKLLHTTHNNTELWLVGDGEKRKNLEQLCQQLELTNHIKFLGSRSDIPELLGQIDIYAFSTTEDEGFGIALIEAMAASLPIIASDVAACREVLNYGEAGILVAPGNAEAMATALTSLVNSPETGKVLGQRACIRAANHYSIQTCAQHWYSLLLN